MCRSSRSSSCKFARQERLCIPGVTMCNRTTGPVRAVLLGPPCRTVSSLRYQGDGGPGVLRDDENPYGRPDLSPSDRGWGRAMSPSGFEACRCSFWRRMYGINKAHQHSWFLNNQKVQCGIESLRMWNSIATSQFFVPENGNSFNVTLTFRCSTLTNIPWATRRENQQLLRPT